MYIQLPNDNFYIDFDKDGNYTLREKKVTKSGKNVGEEYDGVIGYYSTLSSAVKRYISRQLGESGDTVSITDFLERYETLANKVTAFLTPKEVNV